MKKILSVDWDYFMLTNKKDRNHFPDMTTENFKQSITSYVWSTYYASYDKLKDIKIKEADYDYLLDLFNRQNNDIPVIIADSHFHIYDYIINNFKADNSLDIYNIDFHHDMFSEYINKQINCGNWLLKLWNDGYINCIYWANDEDSNTCKEDLLEVEIDSITGNFDVIYLAKSSVWSAPHLDIYFSELVYSIIAKFKNIIRYGELDEITFDRYPKIEQDSIKYKNVIKKLIRGVK